MYRNIHCIHETPIVPQFFALYRETKFFRWALKRTDFRIWCFFGLWHLETCVFLLPSQRCRGASPENVDFSSQVPCNDQLRPPKPKLTHYFTTFPPTAPTAAAVIPGLRITLLKVVPVAANSNPCPVPAAPKSPFLFNAMKLIARSTPAGFFLMMRRIVSAHASTGCIPVRINSTTIKLPQNRITFSPMPVAPAAPMSLSTYSPLPIMGESPTRPGNL